MIYDLNIGVIELFQMIAQNLWDRTIDHIVSTFYDPQISLGWTGRYFQRIPSTTCIIILKYIEVES
jgi:hypothetical protein